jgi:hypothetical protein
MTGATPEVADSVRRSRELARQWVASIPAVAAELPAIEGILASAYLLGFGEGALAEAARSVERSERVLAALQVPK